MQRPYLADAGSEKSLTHLADRVPAAGNGPAVFHQNGTEGHGEEDIVILYELPDRIRGVFLAQALVQKIAGGIDKQGVDTVIQGIVFGIV